ncbi:MAG: hypothetical protein J6Y10_08170 [Lachnospiraceae bacterium]|nr:hypothetical protein [Lachnospiraceae bacterium]
MIAESVIALIWAAAGVAFYGTTQLLGNAIAGLGQSGTVYEISKTMLGTVGGVLAVIGVVVCPITSGDTAFPAVFMSAVSLTYILMAGEGFDLSSGIAYPIGLGFAVALFVVYLVLLKRTKPQSDEAGQSITA